MRSYIAFLFIMLFFIACKKQKNSNTVSFEGIWVETSLRLDTFDFRNGFGSIEQYPTAKFSTNIYIDTVLNPNYPVSHSTFYSYYFTDNMKSIQLRSMLSSSSYFGEFKFSLSGDKRKFTIDKFYNRRALPAIIEFERIK
jgi:hypothetical protein